MTIFNKLLLSLLLLISISAHAQEVYVIPQVGFNINTYDFRETHSSSSNQTLRPGLSAGVGFNIALDELRTFIIQPEINYSMRNSLIDHILVDPSSQNPSASAGSLREKSMLHYLEIPVLARFDFGINTRYYFNLGPSFAYAVGGKEKLESTLPNIESYNRSADFDNRFNRINWAAVIGGGVEFPFNDGFIVVDARFAWGFKTLYKSREIQNINETGVPGTTVIGPEGKNRIFTLSVGYGLPLN
ncbi:PorT family protein [Olivibacter sp. SDN3]|uniref:porin family protein n=1 Tax=Olivibacter sp. SDN3 TaxID=2764720 RepID=UPI0016515269|nr:porin family protein [Olivibacter sp. SDN3]QNL49682.1 PorT family protein [Olivibacter sp. SDN3]